MLTIRLQRTGKRNRPSFRVILTESKRGPKSGGFLEILGFKDPISKETKLKEDRIKYWLSKGVQTSDTVHNLLVDTNIIEGGKKDVSSKKPSKKKAIKEAVSEEKVEEKKEAPKEESPKIEEQEKQVEEKKEEPKKELKEESKEEPKKESSEIEKKEEKENKKEEDK